MLTQKSFHAIKCGIFSDAVNNYKLVKSIKMDLIFVLVFQIKYVAKRNKMN
jgi:hypothetical protein